MEVMVISSRWHVIFFGFMPQRPRSQHPWSSKPSMSNPWLVTLKVICWLVCWHHFSLYQDMLLYGSVMMDTSKFSFIGCFKVLFYWMLQSFVLLDASKFCFIPFCISNRPSLGRHTCFTNISCFDWSL